MVFVHYRSLLLYLIREVSGDIEAGNELYSKRSGCLHCPIVIAGLMRSAMCYVVITTPPRKDDKRWLTKKDEQ